MFKHKTVRKIATYTSLLYILNTAQPLISVSYAQDNQENSEKTLKRQSTHYNLGEDMAEPITLPKEIEDIFSIGYIYNGEKNLFLNDKTTKSILISKYQELIENNSEAKSKIILIYGIMEAIIDGKPFLPDDGEGHKLRESITSVPLNLTKEQLKNRIETIEAGLENNEIYGTNQIYNKIAKQRIAALKEYAENNGLITQKETTIDSGTIPQTTETTTEKTLEQHISYIGDIIYDRLNVFCSAIGNYEDIYYIRNELKNLIIEVKDYYKQNETELESKHGIKDWTDLRGHIAKYITDPENKKDLTSTELVLNCFDSNPEIAITYILETDKIDYFIENYSKKLKEINEFNNLFRNWYLGSEIIEEHIINTGGTTGFSIESLPNYYQSLITTAKEGWASEMTDEEFINTLNMILNEITFESGTDFYGLVNDAIYNPDGNLTGLNNKSDWETFILELKTNSGIGDIQEFLNNSISQTTISTGTSSTTTFLTTRYYTEEEILTKLSELTNKNETILNLILQGYYGKDCELLNDYISGTHKTNTEKYENAIKNLISSKEKQKNDKLIQNFYGNRPYEMGQLLFQTQNDIDILINGRQETIKRIEYDIFGILAVAEAYSNSEVLQNLSGAEWESLISFPTTLPTNYNILIFKNPKIIEQIFRNIPNENDQLRILQTMFGHLTNIYLLSPEEERIKNMEYYLTANIEKIAQALDELKSRYINTRRGHIGITTPMERIGVETIGELYDQLNGFNVLFADLNILEPYPYNSNQSLKFWQAGISVYIPDPYFRERNLQYNTDKDRIISTLNERYNEILLNMRPRSFNRMRGSGFLHHEKEKVDGKLDVALMGPRGENLRGTAKSYLGRGFGTEGVLNENLNNNLSINTGNTCALGINFLNGIFEFSENMYREGTPLKLQNYNNMTSTDLNTIAGGGNIIIMGNTSRDITKGTFYGLDAKTINNAYNFDILVSVDGNWYKLILNKSQKEQLIGTLTSSQYKRHLFGEMMQNMENIDLDLGIEEVKSGDETFDKERFGTFMIGTLPLNKEETIKTGALVVKTTSDETGGALAGEFNIGETKNLVSFGYFTYSNDDLNYYGIKEGENLEITNPTEQMAAFEWLAVKKMRALIYATKNMSGGPIQGGAAVYTKKINGAILYQYDDSRQEANIFASAGYYNKQIMGMGYYKQTMENEKEAGAISQYRINENLTLSIYGKIKDENIFMNNDPHTVRQFGDMAQAIETLAQDIQNNLTRMQADERFKNQKLKDWNTRLWQIMSTFRRWEPRILTENPVNFGICLTDTKTGISTKMTLSSNEYTNPETGEKTQNLYTTGIFTKNLNTGKEFTVIAGTNLSKNNFERLNSNELVNLIGAKFRNDKLVVSLFGTNLGNIEDVEKSWNAGLEYELTGTRLEPGLSMGLRLNVMEDKGWLLKGRIGNNEHGILLDYGEIEGMNTYGIGGKYTFMNGLVLEGLYTFARNPETTDNNWLKREELGLQLSQFTENNFGWHVDFNYNTIKSRGGEYPVLEIKFSFSTPLGK